MIPFLSFHTKRCCLGSHPSPSSSLHDHEDLRRWSRCVQITTKRVHLNFRLKMIWRHRHFQESSCLQKSVPHNNYQESSKLQFLCRFIGVLMLIRKRTPRANCSLLGPNISIWKNWIQSNNVNEHLFISFLSQLSNVLVVFYPSLNQRNSTLSL